MAGQSENESICLKYTWAADVFRNSISDTANPLTFTSTHAYQNIIKKEKEMVIFISFQFQIPQMDLEEVLGSILCRATNNVP